MTDRELFRETFSQLHASEDTLTEVMKVVHKEEQRNGRRRAEKKRRPARTGALIALAAVLLMGTALAGIELSARLSPTGGEAAVAVALAVYGDGSISTEVPEITDKYGNVVEDVPTMERVAVDEETAAELIGDYTADVDATVAVGDYTYTFENFLLDENGMGMLTYTISNPNGVTGWYDAGYGEITFGEDSEIVALAATMGEDWSDGFFDTRDYLLSGTDTELRIVTYMGAFREYEPGQPLYLRLNGRHDTEETLVRVTPLSYAPTVSLTDREGHDVSLSSVGLSIGWRSDHELVTDEVVIHYAGGTAYVVKSDAYKNNVVACWQTGEHIYENCCFVFNRLVDVSAVASVTVSGHASNDGETFEDVSFTCAP